MIFAQNFEVKNYYNYSLMQSDYLLHNENQSK